MDFLEEIKSLDESELREKISSKISDLGENARKLNNDVDTIGYQLSHNPTDYHIDDLSNNEEIDIDLICIYHGYVRKDMKITYGIRYNSNRLVSNGGFYYYVDDEEYVYDFCKYIKEKEVSDVYQLIDYVLEFVDKYLGVFDGYSRDEMFSLISKTDMVFYDLKNEHKFSQFKGMSNGKCSEYTLMAQNILSVFGFDMYMVIGNLKETDEPDEKHAFNFAIFKDEEKGEYVNCLLDFSNYSYVYDINFKKIGKSPYLLYIDEINDDFIYYLLDSKERIKARDFDYLKLSENKFYKIYAGSGKEREYFLSDYIDSYEIINKKLIKRRDNNE